MYKVLLISIIIPFLIQCKKHESNNNYKNISTKTNISVISENTLTSKNQNSINKFEEAKVNLSGQKKNLEKAKKLLFELESMKFKDLDDSEVCFSYIYLGYIEDLSGNRENAINYFKKALSINNDQLKTIHELSKYGLNNPVIWIRHLDSNKKVNENIINTYIIKSEPPENVQLVINLSKKEQLENFELLWEAIDKTYPFFELKNINWNEVKENYKKKIELVSSTTEFYQTLYELIGELKDSHSYFINYKNKKFLSEYTPEILTQLVENKAVITFVDKNSEAYKNGIRVGFEILEIDGLDINKKIETLRKFLQFSSSERNFMENAYRKILYDKKDSKVKIKYRTFISKEIKEITLLRTKKIKKDFLFNNLELNYGKYVNYALINKKYGYLRIRTFNGRNEIDKEFDKALDFLKNTKALIIDIRENTGGYSHPEIVGRLISEDKKVSIGYTKNGPLHDDFEKIDSYYKPSGNWQYSKPLVLLVNSITGSASDLFTTQLISSNRVTTIGTTTHGNLPGESVFVMLPCNLVLNISNGYITDTNLTPRQKKKRY